MTTIRSFLYRLPRYGRTLERIGASLILASLSAAAVAFYFYACLSVARLQQISPDQLIRTFAGA